MSSDQPFSARALHFAGSAVTLRAFTPAAQDLVQFLFGSMPSQGSAEPHRVFDVGEPQDGWLSFSSGFPGGLLGENEPPAAGLPGQVGALLMDQVGYHLADRSTGGLLLHAACLAFEGRQWIFPAVSGSGKSSLAVWLAVQGLDYLSDELCYFPWGAEVCSAWTRPVHLKNGMHRYFPTLDGLPDQAEGRLVSLAALSAGPASATGRVAGFIFPRYEAGARLKYQKLPASQAAIVLARSLINARNLPEHGFPEVLRWVKQVPAYSLVYGGFEQLSEWLAAFKTASLEDWGQPYPAG